MDQIERITHFEEILDKANQVHRELEDALSRFSGIQADLRALNAYYTGADWRQDFRDDEAGLLPRDLKRGVLSEDAAYDTLTENRELLTRMLETVTEVLKAQ